MASFNKWFAKMRVLEGGYANVASDRGGETYQGVTRRSFPDWPGWPLVEAAKAANGGSLARNTIINNPALAALVLDLSKREFWDKIGGGQIKSQELAELIADWAYHSGAVTALRAVQRRVGVLTDGQPGGATITAINKVNPATLFTRLLADRQVFLRQLVANDPSQGRFLAGWLNRLAALDTPANRATTGKLAVALLLVGLGVYTWQQERNERNAARNPFFFSTSNIIRAL